MKKKQTLVLSCILLCLVPMLLFSQVERTTFAGRGKVGSTGLQFLKIGVSARAVGMAESFIGMADDASAMYYNPAGLNQLHQNELFFTHTQWPAGINYEYLGGVMVIPRIGKIGAQVSVLTTGDMKRTVPYVGWTGEYFSATDWLVGLSYARGLTDKFSVGVNVKVIAEWLDNEQVTVAAADFGTLFDVGYRGIKFGMTISNFGPNGKFLREDFSLPINFKFGAVGDLWKSGAHWLRLNVEGSHPNDNIEQIALGSEYTFSKYFALRAGYRWFVKTMELDEVIKLDNNTQLAVAEPLEGISFGFGVQIPWNKLATRIDYAYTDLGFLDIGQRFTIAFQF